MDIGTITSLIGSVGFPVCVCLICFWYINKQQESHKEEIGNLTNALHNNTVVMQQLVDHLSGGVDGKDN